MKIKAIKCKKCGYTIYSRTRHDFKICKCKSVYIDGGFDYLKCGGDFENIEMIEIEVNATKKELYIDWNQKNNKYGEIPNNC